MSSRTKTIGAAMGSVVLLGSTALGFAAAQGSAETQAAEGAGASAVAAAQADQSDAQASGTVDVAQVRGEFSFTQDAVTPSASIATTFVRAVSSMCASMPEYLVAQIDPAIAVQRSDGSHFQATVSEMEGEEGAEAFLMACSCASNVAGGGAVANAEVSGVSFETVARLAGELD